MRCSYGQHLPSSGELATEPPVLPPQANLTPLDLGLPASDAAWPEVCPCCTLQMKIL